MKVVLVILMSMFVNNLAFAELTPVKETVREFTVKKVTDETGFELPEYTSGKMSLGETTITIVLNDAVGVALDVSVPIKGFTGSGCGDLYVAGEDKMPVDGARIDLEVSDFTGVECKMFFPNAAEAVLKIQSHKGFTAEESERIFVIEFAQSFN